MKAWKFPAVVPVKASKWCIGGHPHIVVTVFNFGVSSGLSGIFVKSEDSLSGGKSASANCFSELPALLSVMTTADGLA